MSGIPFGVAMAIQGHLDEIATFFKNPTVTLVIRNPDLEDADLVMTRDDPHKVIAAIKRLADREEEK